MAYSLKVSVVVPTYNVERYLDEAISSILNQTLKEIEVICIDDGSNDASGAMLDGWSARDGRIRVLHKENGGYGKAVNLGIREAGGEYISIIEPDDHITVDMLESLYSVAAKYDLDFSKSNFYEFYGDGENLSVNKAYLIENQALYNRVIRPRDVPEVFKGRIMNPSGIYKRAFLKEYNICHNETEGASYQDIGFWFQVMGYARRGMLVPGHFYYYRQDNPESSTVSRDKAFCICDEFEFVSRKLKGQAWDFLFPEIQYSKFLNYMLTFNRIADHHKLGFLNRLRQEFAEAIESDPRTLDKFPAYDKDRLLLILQDSEGYYGLIKEGAGKVRQAFRQAEEVVIYGAGRIGKQILNGLPVEDRCKLLGFVVTDISRNQNRCEGFPVYDITALKEKRETVGVIVGVSMRYRQDVVETLKDHGFKNIVLINGLE